MGAPGTEASTWVNAHTHAPDSQGASSRSGDGNGSIPYKATAAVALLVDASLKLALGFTHAGLLSQHALSDFSAAACFQCFLKMLCLAQLPILGGPLKAFKASATCRISNEEPTAERSFTVTIQTS